MHSVLQCESTSSFAKDNFCEESTGVLPQLQIYPSMDLPTELDQGFIELSWDLPRKLMECSSSLQHLIVIILDRAESISLSYDTEAPLKPLRTCSKGGIYLLVTASPIVQGELERRLLDSIHTCSPSQFSLLQLQPCIFVLKYIM